MPRPDHIPTLWHGQWLDQTAKSHSRKKRSSAAFEWRAKNRVGIEDGRIAARPVYAVVVAIDTVAERIDFESMISRHVLARVMVFWENILYLSTTPTRTLSTLKTFDVCNR